MIILSMVHHDRNQKVILYSWMTKLQTYEFLNDVILFTNMMYEKLYAHLYLYSQIFINEWNHSNNG